MAASDAELARDALAGSEAAYRELVIRYATPAVNFIFRFVRDRALAEDLAQEGFLRVYQRLNTFDPQRKFSSWFFQVLRNITIDYLRVNRLPTSSLDELAEEGVQGAAVDRDSASPEQLAGQSELATAMGAALSR
ncbi:MAG TPA: sigma-70 family RNA polymerase sigma factor, partial [Vicinamibacterales bacterium]